MRNNKNRVRKKLLLEVVMEICARALIMIIVLFILGKETNPNWWSVAVIDVVCLWWVMSPMLDFWYEVKK
jgi:hypothetical protein